MVRVSQFGRLTAEHLVHVDYCFGAWEAAAASSHRRGHRPCLPGFAAPRWRVRVAWLWAPWRLEPLVAVSGGAPRVL